MSLIKDTNSVSYYTNIINGYEFIDLGLSVRWATCNIGATKPEEYGWYFMWGDTIAYNSDRTPVNGGEAISFDWLNYPLCNGSDSSMTKYCPSSDYGIVDNKTILDLEDDAAHIHVGIECRMPTEDEFNELISACNKTYITNYNNTGIVGELFELKSDSSKTLFFPTSGNLMNEKWTDAKTYGYYWSSSLRKYNPYNSMYLFFGYNYCHTTNTSRRCGSSIRAVLPN